MPWRRVHNLTRILKLILKNAQRETACKRTLDRQSFILSELEELGFCLEESFTYPLPGKKYGDEAVRSIMLLDDKNKRTLKKIGRVALRKHGFLPLKEAVQALLAGKDIREIGFKSRTKWWDILYNAMTEPCTSRIPHVSSTGELVCSNWETSLLLAAKWSKEGDKERAYRVMERAKDGD